MSSALDLLLAGMVGIVLGAIFFGGLWVTVRIGLRSPFPALWFVFSFILRTAIVLGGLAWVGLNHGDQLAMCLLGFLFARILVGVISRKSVVNPTSAKAKVSHAS